MRSEAFSELLEAVKRVAAVLQEHDVPFLLAGGLASWVRGGPPTEHDVDLALRPDDVERVKQVLAEAGFRVEQPPEQWLFKAWDGDVLIDLIFRPSGPDVDDAMFERGDELEVEAVTMHVMSAEDVLITKLLSLGEHHLDYDSVMELARALREQIDWDSARRRTEESPYAKAFFTMVDELGLAPA